MSQEEAKAALLEVFDNFERRKVPIASTSKAKLGESLGLSAGPELDELHRVMLAEGRTYAGAPVTAEDRSALDAFITRMESERDVPEDWQREYRLRTLQLDEMEAKRLVGTTQRPRERAYAAFVDRIRQLETSLTVLEARSQIVHAQRATWPGSRFAGFPPRLSLAPLDDAPEAPAVDERYASIAESKGSYWNAPAYKELVGMDASSLPDGAMIPLLALTERSTQALTRGDDQGTPVRELLPKYGERLYPALVELARHPEKYPWAKDIDREKLFTYTQDWPPAMLRDLFRAAFRSGWTKVWVYARKAQVPKDSCVGLPRSPYVRR